MLLLELKLFFLSLYWAPSHYVYEIQWVCLQGSQQVLKQYILKNCFSKTSLILTILKMKFIFFLILTCKRKHLGFSFVYMASDTKNQYQNPQSGKLDYCNYVKLFRFLEGSCIHIIYKMNKTTGYNLNILAYLGIAVHSPLILIWSTGKNFLFTLWEN